MYWPKTSVVLFRVLERTDKSLLVKVIKVLSYELHFWGYNNCDANCQGIFTWLHEKNRVWVQKHYANSKIHFTKPHSPAYKMSVSGLGGEFRHSPFQTCPPSKHLRCIHPHIKWREGAQKCPSVWSSSDFIGWRRAAVYSSLREKVGGATEFTRFIHSFKIKSHHGWGLFSDAQRPGIIFVRFTHTDTLLIKGFSLEL